jgi:hypothetical protein
VLTSLALLELLQKLLLARQRIHTIFFGFWLRSKLNTKNDKMDTKIIDKYQVTKYALWKSLQK